MRNRAKCRLCQEVIESFHETDLIHCSCKQIGIWGGLTSYKTFAEDYKNFLRVDEEDREIEVKVQGIDASEERSDPVKEIDHMIKMIEDLPDIAKMETLNQYDFLRILYILKSFIRGDN